MRGLSVLIILFSFNIATAANCPDLKPVPSYDLNNFITKASTNPKTEFCLNVSKTVPSGQHKETDYEAYIKLFPNGVAQIYYRDQMWSTKYPGFHMDIGYNFMITNQTQWSIQKERLVIEKYGSGIAVKCESGDHAMLNFNFDSSTPIFTDDWNRSFQFEFRGETRTLDYQNLLDCGIFWKNPLEI